MRWLWLSSIKFYMALYDVVATKMIGRYDVTGCRYQINRSRKWALEKIVKLLVNDFTLKFLETLLLKGVQ